MGSLSLLLCGYQFISVISAWRIYNVLVLIPPCDEMGSYHRKVVSADRPEGFCVDLLGRNVAALKIGLEVGHETSWAAKVILGINIIDELVQ